MESLALILVIIGLLLPFIMLTAGLILYILFCVGLYQTAKRREMDTPFLAAIPLPMLQIAYMAYMTENDVHRQMRGKMTHVYLIILGITVIFTLISPYSAAVWVMYIVQSAFLAYVYYFYFSRLTSRHVLHTILASIPIVGGMILCLQVFVFRGRDILPAHNIETGT